MERLLTQPRKRWKLARKLEILRKTSANEHDLSTGKDKKGRIKRGKAATGMWKDLFKEVLNAGGNLSQKSTVEDQVLEAEPQRSQQWILSSMKKYQGRKSYGLYQS